MEKLTYNGNIICEKKLINNKRILKSMPEESTPDLWANIILQTKTSFLNVNIFVLLSSLIYMVGYTFVYVNELGRIVHLKDNI